MMTATPLPLEIGDAVRAAALASMRGASCDCSSAILPILAILLARAGSADKSLEPWHRESRVDAKWLDAEITKRSLESRHGDHTEITRRSRRDHENHIEITSAAAQALLTL